MKARPPVKATASETGRDVRSRMAADLERHYDDKVGTFFEEALGAEKSAWGSCSHCHHKVQVDVPDWGARTRALQLLIEQGYGRLPRADEEGSPTTIIVERMCACGEEKLCEKTAELRAELRRTHEELVFAGWTPPPEQDGTTRDAGSDER